MFFTRRDAGKLALAALSGASLSAKPNSRFSGVQVGLIVPYSYRGTAASAEDVLKNTVQLGISGVELMNPTAESFAGAPELPARGRGPVTAEQKEAMRTATAELKKWRLGVPMEKFKTLRKMYNTAGVDIYAFKLGLTDSMSDEEYEYTFDVADALGAGHVTMELPRDAATTKRIGDFAAKRKKMVGYHNHTQVNAGSWDTALEQSKYNGINLDVGHYTAATDEPVIAFMKKHHGRIQSLHLKDRKRKEGPNQPWGQGETPLREVLQLMKSEKWKFPASIELEYPVADGSTVMAELAKCVEFCKSALA